MRAQKGKRFSGSKGKREVLLIVEHYRKLGTPAANKAFDVFEKGISVWAEANVNASEREDSSGSGGLLRELTKE